MRLGFVAAFPILLIAFAPVAQAATEATEATEAAEAAEATEEKAFVAETEELFADIERLRSEYRDLAQQEREASGDERTVAALQAQRRLLEFTRAVGKLVGNVVKQLEKGHEDAGIVQKTRTLLWELDRRIPEFLDEVESETAALRASLSEESPDTASLLGQIDEGEDVIDEIVRFNILHIGYLDSLGMSSKNARENAATRLKARAGNLSGRLELTHQRVDEAVAAQESATDAAAETAVRDARDDLDRVASSLWTTCDMMDQLKVPTAEYRQVLIQTTGEISTDVFDWDVITGLLEDGGIAAQRWVERRAPALFSRLALFSAIMAAFWVLGRIARRGVSRLMGSSSENISELARRIIVSSASRTVMTIGFFVALSEVGVNVTALLAGLGIAGFIIGFALQETLGNFASGTMILIYRPFDVGDVIEAGGVMGTVHNMNLVSTTFLTFDNQTLVVPNSRIWGNVIRNVTHQRTRRVDLRFYFEHGADIERAEALLTEICRAHPSVLEDPEPAIKVHEITQNAVIVVARPWVNTADYWPTYWDLNREATIRFATEKIRMGVSWPELPKQEKVESGQ